MERIICLAIGLLLVFFHGSRYPGQQPPYAKGAQGQVLGGHQGILVKKGQLRASESHIHDGGPLLNDFIKFCCLGSYGLIADEPLL